MSFTTFLQDGPLLTREQVMATLIQVAHELSMPDERGACIIAGITVSQEVGVKDNDPPYERRFWCPANHADEESFGFAHDSESNDGRSVGYFQQQKGPNGELWWGTTSQEMDLHSSATSFMTRLKANGYDASNAQSANDAAQAVQQSGVPNAYGQWFDDINALYNAVVSGSGTTPPVVTPPASTGDTTVADRPDFNEYEMWSSSNQSRGGTKIDLFLLHTQEGNGNADSLAQYLQNPANQVSYHYTVSTGYPNDNGVTVCDVVDTDDASWSVLSANNRSINLCFAGSSASWSRNDWLTKAGRAIDVAAYLAVQDCQKYGISLKVVPPPYTAGTPGISDHMYVTDVLKDGTHTDVGPDFPWDVFSAAVEKYSAAPQPADDPTPPAAPTRVGPADDQLTLRWNQLGGQTLVEAVAEIRDHVLGTDDRQKEGAL